MRKSKKLFFKSFVIGFAVYLAAVAVFFSMFYQNSRQREAAESSQAPVYAPSINDKFSVMLSLSQKEGQTPYAFFLVSFDAGVRQISVTRLFSETSLLKDDDKLILKEQFEKGGINGVIDSVNSVFSLEISKHISFTNDSFITFLSHFEPTVLEVPRAVCEINQKKDIYIKIDGGRQALGSVLLCDYIAVTEWDSPNQTLFESSRALCAFLSQNGGELFKSAGSETENALLSLSENNLSIAEIEKRREMLNYLLKDGDCVISRSAEGEFKNFDTEFVLSSQTQRMISAIY